jgi:Mce-associated membrane protein
VTGSSPLRLTIVAVAAVLALAASGLAAVAAGRVADRHALDRARTEAVAAATSGVGTVLSYDYRHLQRDFKQAEALLTPNFRKQYVKTTAAGVLPLAAKYHATSTAVVPEGSAGVVSAGLNRAVVLVFVEQTVTNSQLAAPRLDRARIDVTVLRTGGRWLIDKLAPI